MDNGYHTGTAHASCPNQASRTLCGEATKNRQTKFLSATACWYLNQCVGITREKALCTVPEDDDDDDELRTDGNRSP